MKYFKKSRAAFEFLATYAWTLLIIFIMITALAYFGVLSPSNLWPERCSISQEISCEQSIIGQTDSGTGVLMLRLKNNVNGPIIVASWDTTSESQVPFSCTQKPIGGIWPNGETRDVEFTGCNNKDAGLVLGEKGKVSVKINYYLADSSSSFSREVEGEILATVISVEGILSLPECSDDTDNDNNGCIDYTGGDTGCSNASDTEESGGTCQQNGGAGQPLYCFVSNVCSDTLAFRMSALKDAHAEIPSMSNYDYKVCCRSHNDILSNSCSSPDVVLLHLSGATDAHVEKNTQSNYATKVCLSANAQTISCGYTTSNCLADETCLATISSDTDAHAGDCVTQPFTNKICCKIV